jgi:hypothetical protein
MIPFSVNALKPKMKLAGPVYNHQGNLLLKEQTELSERSILMLKSWGIRQVLVEGRREEGVDAGIEPGNGIGAEVEKILQERFSGVLDDPVMVEIMKAAARCLEKRGPDRR